MEEREAEQHRQDEQPRPRGGTKYDVILDFVDWLRRQGRTRRLSLAAVCALLLVTAFVLGVIVVFVHEHAKPDAQISLLYGLIVYTPGQTPPVPCQAPRTDVTDFVLPRHLQLEEGRVLPLLDRAINISWTKYQFIRLSGTNIAHVRVAVRAADGSPLKPIVDHQELALEVPVDREPSFEIEIDDHHFGLDITIGAAHHPFLDSRELRVASMSLMRLTDM